MTTGREFITLKRLTMKKNFLILFSLAALLSTFSCATNMGGSGRNTVVTPLSEKTSLNEGTLVYGLPLTVVDIFVETERVIERPGPYSGYAGEMLGLNDVIREENESWAIRSISVKTHEELDPSEFYVIESTSLFQTNVLKMKKAGLLLDLNPDIYLHNETDYNQKESDMNALRVLDLGADQYFMSQRDTAYRTVNVDTAFIRIPYLVEKKKKLTIDQLAERAAVRLMELRDGKHLILTGEANVFPQDEAAIRELNRLEKEYTELFTGKTFTETRTFRYQVIPSKEMTGKQTPVFRFSATTGPSSSADGKGNPVTLEFIPEQKTKGLSLITKQKTTTEKDYDKLYYRIPDMVTARISLGKEELCSTRMLVYQYGDIIHLPSNYIIGQ